MRIAERCYPSCNSPEEAMQQLLMDNILPLALRRKPVSVMSIMRQPVIEELFRYYEDALNQLFRFYATASAKSASSKSLLKTTSAQVKTFDDQRKIIERLQDAGKKSSENSLSNSIGYTDFVRFSGDFGLQSSMGLTMLDLGDIYLSIISMQNFETSVRKMTFREFWEALVRSSLIAFKNVPGLLPEEKVKSMFLYMWRHIQESVQEQVNGTMSSGGGMNTYKGGLIRGAQILNERFIAAWAKDGYKDYLDTAPPVPSFNSTEAKASSMLNKLITRSKDALAGSSAAASSSSAGAGADGTDSTAAGGGKRVLIDIDDDADLGDDRIRPSALRQLLQNRPDIASLLHACVVEENLDSSDMDLPGCTTTSGMNVVSVPSTARIEIGSTVSGTGIAVGVTVVAIDATKSVITLSSVVALSGSCVTLTFST